MANGFKVGDIITHRNYQLSDIASNDYIITYALDALDYYDICMLSSGKSGTYSKFYIDNNFFLSPRKYGEVYLALVLP